MIVALEDARYARDRRAQKRRTNSGYDRPIPWDQIIDELMTRGRPEYSALDLQDAVSRLPLEDHPDAPTPAAAMSKIEAGFRTAWSEEFPGQPWPGLHEAQRKIREKNFQPAAGAAAEKGGPSAA
jgi:hypothetical protein